MPELDKVTKDSMDKLFKFIEKGDEARQWIASLA